MISKISLQNYPYYSFDVELSEETYTINIKNNATVDSYSMDILSIDETPIQEGIKLVENINLIGTINRPDMPEGSLFYISTNDGDYFIYSTEYFEILEELVEYYELD